VILAQLATVCACFQQSIEQSSGLGCLWSR